MTNDLLNRKCNFCDNEVSEQPCEKDGFWQLFCHTCESYIISKDLHQNFSEKFRHLRDKRYIISGVLKNKSNNTKPMQIEADKIEDLIESAKIPDGPFDLLEKVLDYVLKEPRNIGEGINISPDRDYPLFFAKSKEECSYILEHAVKLNYLEHPPFIPKGRYRLTPEGWKYLMNQKKKVDSRQAFVAMSFDTTMEPAWKNGFFVALDETGYKPYRIDKSEHNEKIDDKIIAEIRKSGLLIADFTGHRGGVYFEAGFAMGLGIPIIWTCRKDDSQKVHFDTRQYNHIFWENPDDLKEKLINRIEATVPLI